MNPKCEQVRLSAMAHADGEAAALPSAEVEGHLAACAECRAALAEMEAATRLLEGHRLKPQTIHLADRVQEDIAAATRSRSEAKRFTVLFLALLLILLAERAVTLRGDATTRWACRGVACLLVVGWFIGQRENPFSLHEQLRSHERIAL